MKLNEPEWNELEGDGPAVGSGPGRALAAARVALGLSVEEVASKLHLAVNTVLALEADDYKGLPPAIFVRGYLKNFARLLNLDPRAIVDAYERQSGRDGSAQCAEIAGPVAAPEESGYGVALMLLMLGAFVGLGWWVYQSGGDRESAPGSTAIVAGEAPAVVSAAPQSASEPTPPGRAEADRANAAMPPQQASAEPPQAAPDAGPSGSGTPATRAGVQSLRLRFLGDSWVSVVDADGTRLLYELGGKGAEKVVQGKAPFALVLGRPADISLEYNGHPYDHGHTDNRSPARFSLGP